MAINNDKNILIFDIEGTDSHEREGDCEIIENKISLFALAMADVVLINIFAVNIGRKKGSGFDLL